MNGTQTLVALVEEAVALQGAERIVERLRTGLCDLINSGEVELPPRILQTNADHYARRLLHSDEANSVCFWRWL